MDMKLTGDDLALAESAVQLALAWCKSNLSNSHFKAQQIAAYDALNKKLAQINSHAYPYDSSDEMEPDVGNEPIMILDAGIVEKTRSRARSSTG